MKRGILSENTLIRQAERQIEARLKPGMRESYMKIVVAGMKYAMKGGDKSILAQLEESENPIEAAVKGAIGIVGLLGRAAKGAMPGEAAVPASFALVLQALDYLDRRKIMKIGKPELDQAAQMFAEEILPALGMTPGKVDQLAGSVSKFTQDPEQLAQLQNPAPSQLGARQ